MVEFKDSVQFVPIESIKPNPWNPRKRNEKRLITDTARHIRQVGFMGAVFVRDVRDIPTIPADWEIIDGEHRWLALRSLEVKECPIISLGEMTEAQAKARTLNFNLAHGQMDVIEVAHLVGSLKRDLGDDVLNGRLAVTDEEIKNLANIATMDFTTAFQGAEDTNPPEMEVHVFHLNRRQNDTVNAALAIMEREERGATKSRWLELIFADFLAGPEEVANV